MECVLGSLREICHPDGRQSNERRVMVHFDNAPIHNSEETQEYLTNLGFKRIEHSPYSPDLAPWDFYLFAAMRENLSGQGFESVDELSFAFEALVRGLPADFLLTVFLEWEQRIGGCCEIRGEYIDETGHNCIFISPIPSVSDESPGQYRTPYISPSTDDSSFCELRLPSESAQMD
jgi:histone-lysine N-methyltransferase SETMAR